MTVRRNGFEGQTNGAAVTTGNSAASGDALTEVVGTVTYSTAHPAHRSMGVYVAGTGTQSLIGNNNFSGTNWRVSFYLYLPTVGASWQLYQCRTSVGQAWGLGFSAAGKLQALDSAGVVIPGTLATTALTAATLYRVEAQAVSSATVGNVVYQYYSVSGGVETLVQSVTPTTPNTANTRGGNFTWGRFGRISTAGPADIYIDSIQAGDDSTTALGPWKAPTAAFTSTPTGLTVAFDATTSTPVSPNTISSYAWNYGDTATDTGATTSHTYAAPGPYTVTLTVTDNTGLTDTVVHPVTVAASLATVIPVTVVAATFTPSVGTLLTCLADSDPATLITSGTAPTAVTVAITYGPVLAPLAGQGLTALFLTDRLSSTAGTVSAQLFEGATLRSTLAAQPIPAGTAGGVTAPPVMFDFPASDMAAITSFAALKVTYTINATGAASTVRVATSLLYSPQAVWTWNGTSWGVAVPAALVLTATPQPANNPPRVMIEIDNITAPTADILRIDGKGATTPVRGGEPAMSTSGLVVVYDYEVPYNQPVTYTAAGLTSAPVTVTVSQSWLVHPGVPSLSQPIQPLSPVSDETADTAAGVHQVVGRSTAIVVTDGRRKAPTFTLGLLTDTQQQEVGLVGLFYDTSPLLLQIVDPAIARQQYRWLAVGAVTMSTPGDFGNDLRVWSLPCIEIDRPVGGVQAQRTYAGLITEAATYADLRLLYRTYRGVLTGEAGT